MNGVKRRVTLSLPFLVASLLAAAQTRNSSVAAILSENSLKGAAIQTYANFVNAYTRGDANAWPEGSEAEIPAKYWTDPIKALKPIKVYIHRINIVVVQRMENGIEEGKYILNLVSSYLPQNGDDGFQFTPNPQRNNLYYTGGSVLDFRRIRDK